MICQSCQQSVATVHLTEIVQKSKRETHLCEECARTKGVAYAAQFSVKDYLSGLGKEKAVATPKPAADVFEPCPACGITFNEFRQTGRLGCARDYEHFRRGLEPLLEKIHGARQHTGRVPLRIGARLERDRQVQRYQQELAAAIAAENYEQAAELRDKIRELERAGERPA